LKHHTEHIKTTVLEFQSCVIKKCNYKSTETRCLCFSTYNKKYS